MGGREENLPAILSLNLPTSPVSTLSLAPTMLLTVKYPEYTPRPTASQNVLLQYLGAGD